jgi:tetratricopeptide (TPR) repeat protein
MRVLAVVTAFLLAAPGIAAEAQPPAPPETPQASVEETESTRLDMLFAALESAPSVAAGKAIEREIWAEWLRSGDSEIDAMMTAAMMAMQLRAFASAISLLDKVVAQKPDYAEGWNKRATVFYYVDQYDRSLADIERTLALEPRHFGALAGLGMIMQDTGNISGAIAAFERAVAVNPSLTNLKLAIEQLRARIGRDI